VYLKNIDDYSKKLYFCLFKNQQPMTSPQHQVPGPSWHTTLSRASIPSWSSCKSCENRGSDNRDGAVGGFINGVGQSALNGDAFNEVMVSGLKGAGIGAAIGVLSGAIAGGVQAYRDNKNIWLGRDIAMGRTAWSFKNTDLKPTVYFRETLKGNGINVNRIDHISKQAEKGTYTWRSTLDDKVYNYVYNEHPKQSVYVGNMKGRGYLDYSGWVPEGHQVSISFDNNLPAITLSSGNYTIPTTITIPSGTQYVNIHLYGSYPLYYQNSIVFSSPFRSLIYGRLW
jgi:hypothetical protein